MYICAKLMRERPAGVQVWYRRELAGDTCWTRRERQGVKIGWCVLKERYILLVLMGSCLTLVQSAVSVITVWPPQTAGIHSRIPAWIWLSGNVARSTSVVTSDAGFLMQMINSERHLPDCVSLAVVGALWSLVNLFTQFEWQAEAHKLSLLL